MEYAIKAVVTLFAVLMIWGISKFTIKLWCSHVDPNATIAKVISTFQKEPTDLIVTREDDALYQNGEIVGHVVGKITESGDTLLLEDVADTSKLKQDQDIEFRRMKIRLVNFGSISGIKSVVAITDAGQTSSVLNAVISDARFKIISKK
jgi:hypothetical protein